VPIVFSSTMNVDNFRRHRGSLQRKIAVWHGSSGVALVAHACSRL
jgi:hypothetical protein